MLNEDKIRNSLYQIPKIRIVARDIFEAPTIFLIISEMPYYSNSTIIFSLLNTQTIITEIATII